MFIFSLYLFIYIIAPREKYIFIKIKFIVVVGKPQVRGTEQSHIKVSFFNHVRTHASHMRRCGIKKRGSYATPCSVTRTYGFPMTTLNLFGIYYNNSQYYIIYN